MKNKVIKNNKKKGIPDIKNIKCWKPMFYYDNIKENNGYIIASKYYHKLFINGKSVINNSFLEKIDDKNYDIFTVSHETNDGYFCCPLMNCGFVNCYVYKEDTRPFLDKEIEYLNKISNIPITPCKNLF